MQIVVDLESVVQGCVRFLYIIHLHQTLNLLVNAI